MSRPFRGLPKPQMIFLCPNLVLIEQNDPDAQAVRMSTNTYALLSLGSLYCLI